MPAFKFTVGADVRAYAFDVRIEADSLEDALGALAVRMKQHEYEPGTMNFRIDRLLGNHTFRLEAVDDDTNQVGGFVDLKP